MCPANIQVAVGQFELLQLLNDLRSVDPSDGIRCFYRAETQLKVLRDGALGQLLLS